MERYQQLGAQAAQTEEDLSQAQDDLAAKVRERDAANDALQAALGRRTGNPGAIHHVGMFVGDGRIVG